MLMKVMTKDEKGITRLELNLKERYDTLKQGTYRIVKDNNFAISY